MKSWVGQFCIFPTILCRFEPPDSCYLRGDDLKCGGSRLGSTPNVEPSKHLKMKILWGISHLFMNILPGSGGNFKKMEVE